MEAQRPFTPAPARTTDGDSTNARVRSRGSACWALLVALVMVAAACGGDDASGDESTASDSGIDSSDTEPEVPDQDDEDAAETADLAALDDEATSVAPSGRATRFHEADWLLVDIRRQPDGPWDEGEDKDPTEDFIHVDLDVRSPVDGVELRLPYEWVTLVHADGSQLRPFEEIDRGTGEGFGPYVDVTPSRTQEITVVFAVDADTSFDGGRVELDQPGRAPAALSGPLQVDESARISAGLDGARYEGPFSRDAATVDVIEAYWSRELGVDDDSELIESPDFASRRPPEGMVWLLMHFEITCESTGIDTGGCNVYGGWVDVDGQTHEGSLINGRSPYGVTTQFWAAYPVPVDAESVTIQIGEPNGGAATNFSVDDLSPLQSLDHGLS